VIALLATLTVALSLGIPLASASSSTAPRPHRTHLAATAGAPAPGPDETIRILMLGDSLTAGLPSRLPYSLELGRLLTAAGVKHEFYNAGIGGATVTDLLAWTTPLIQSIQPNLVLLNVGTNDAASSDAHIATFEGKYRQLIEKIRTAKPDTNIVVSWLFYSTHPALARGQGLVNDAIFRVATPGFKLRPEFLALADMQSMPSHLLVPPSGADGLHPGQIGYEVMGRYWYRAIRDSGWLTLPAIPEEADRSGHRP
jgi:lysophospholipase L1-like esterase